MSEVSANATPRPVVEIPGSIGGCSYLVGYAIGSGRFIESLADLVEALCMADAYLHRLAISRGERSIAPGEGAAHMRVWRHSQRVLWCINLRTYVIITITSIVG